MSQRPLLSLCWAATVSTEVAGMYQRLSSWNSVSGWNLQWDCVFSSSETASIWLGNGIGWDCSVFPGTMLQSVDRHPRNLHWSSQELKDAASRKAFPKHPSWEKKKPRREENQGKTPPALSQLFSFKNRRERARAKRQERGA